jgi:hypothetical protein
MTWPGVAPELVASLLVCLKICGYISSHNAILYIDIVLTIAWIFAWSFSRETKPDSAIEQAISVSFRTLKRLSSSSWCDALTVSPRWRFPSTAARPFRKFVCASVLIPSKYLFNSSVTTTPSNTDAGPLLVSDRSWTPQPSSIQLQVS